MTRKTQILAIAWTLTFLLLLCSRAFAGGLETFAFTSAGLRVDLGSSATVSNDLVFVEARVKQLCADGSGKICIHWNLVLDDPAHETVYAGRLSEALQIWSLSSNLNINMDYAGVLAANPTSSGSDSFGNPAMAGNFIVSFAPPSDITFADAEVSTARSYVLPDLAAKSGEIKWTGIYFNPQYKPDQDYDLRTALLHEVGKAIGLSPSSVSAAVMYPVKIGKTFKGGLHSDDLLWASSFYATNSFAQSNGSLSGNFLNGKDGSPWVGASIAALPVSSAKTFADNLDRKLFTASASSDRTGEFKFRSLSPGNYILFAEVPETSSMLSEFLQKFATKDKFNSEFYDGADRESNQESVYAFTPQSIFYAAQVTVELGKETTGVTFVSNVADPKIPRIAAKGSSNEKLSVNWVSPADKAAKDSPEPAPPSDSSGGGGCELSASPLRGNGFSLLGLAFALFLLLRVRRDLKVKSYPVECQIRGRPVR